MPAQSKQLTLGYMPDGTGKLYPFNAIFDRAVNVLTDGIEGIDALILWGGEDICPSYYNQKPHPRNQCQSGIPTMRDQNEWKAMRYAKANGIPIIGVCRGAQFLCAFSGGSLIQHVTGHHSTHNVQVYDDVTTVYETSSCHHQMMHLKGTDYQLLAWTPTSLSKVYEGEDGKTVEEARIKLEPEVVYFPQTRGLAIQGHPEWMKPDDPFVLWCLDKTQNLLLKSPEPVEEPV
jgi:gamma-glutamyl-gamma-aminobutyrate hydrolase PuuD